ncbi:helix-turn-helix domain-containing protein [Sphingomonas sp. KR1UV-12]|uniref:Helix-turn-helix domain-containing protein n=1 Tax=Sphingomonas aurea TaxID=3063994 RepID=A0ABT9EID4_9SPHN|nr:TetR/AcrR family transcriptional regulator [Sphingomonas sp. KR1UV-12]MDP1026726.1 helix-turn-helix domain-containing protein [Sphingomonas sp. KR1UV-12]
MADDPNSPRRAPRRDAQARREALIVAAASCFAARGYGVPLEVIADEAGVGRGTLYRNFRDREALALAIFSREVDRMEAALDPAAPLAGSIATMVRSGAPAASLFTRIAAELKLDDANIAAFRALGVRLEGVVAPAVKQAQARGEIAATVTPHAVVLAMRMAGGLLLPFMTEAEVSEQLNAALALLFEGLQPR